MAFSSGSAGGLKGLEISREGVEATLPPILDVVGVTADDRLASVHADVEFPAAEHVLCRDLYDFDIIITDYAQLMAAHQAAEPHHPDRAAHVFPDDLYALRQFPALKRRPWTVLAARSRSCRAPAPAVPWRARPVSGILPAVRRQACALLITGMAPIKRRCGRILPPDAAAALRILRHGGDRLADLPAAGLQKIRLGGKADRGINLQFLEDGEIIVRARLP